MECELLLCFPRFSSFALFCEGSLLNKNMNKMMSSAASAWAGFLILLALASSSYGMPYEGDGVA